MVLVAGDVQRLVVLRLRHQPQLLRRRVARSNSALAISGLMYVSPSPWIISSGRLSRPAAFSTLGYVTPRLRATFFAPAMPIDAVEPRRQHALEQRAVAVDLNPPPHVRHHRGVRGVRAVGHHAAHPRVGRGDEHARAAALADAEDADAAAGRRPGGARRYVTAARMSATSRSVTHWSGS